MRKWRPPDVNVDDEWAVRYQIVIPKSYREEVLSLAHGTPRSFGDKPKPIRKSYDIFIGRS